MKGEWQPIETAPTDGTRILGYTALRYGSFMGVIWRGLPHWQSAERGVVDPTHWMPLPKPPYEPGEED